MTTRVQLLSVSFTEADNARYEVFLSEKSGLEIRQVSHGRRSKSEQLIATLLMKAPGTGVIGQRNRKKTFSLTNWRMTQESASDVAGPFTVVVSPQRFGDNPRDTRS